MDTAHKLKVFETVKTALNEQGITWAVGGSMMLYFRGIVSDFHDIDLMVAEADEVAVQNELNKMGTVERREPGGMYKTRVFLECLIDGVELDVMAGFTIVADGADHYFPLEKTDIDFTPEAIPLHSLKAWHEMYRLMGRDAKVKLIDAHT